METRNIRLSLDKAKELFKAGGGLIEVALQAYDEKELHGVSISKTEGGVSVIGYGEAFLILDIPDFCAKWDGALELAEKFEFLLPTKSQLKLAWEHRDEINKHLNHPFYNYGWYWTNEQDSACYAWYLSWSSGCFDSDYKKHHNSVRAFAALPF